MLNYYVDVELAVKALKKGEIIILVDNEDRENEGDFIIAAEKTTPEAVNFMAKHGRGLICLTITPERAKELDLPLMENVNSALHSTAFTVSIDVKDGTTTGISAFDRFLTVKKAVDPSAKPEDFCRPGHMFPIIAKEGGLLARNGHTEASVELMKLAGLYPAGVICEIMDEDGRMAKREKLQEIAKNFDLRILQISDLLKYIKAREKKVVRLAEAKLPTEFGEFKIVTYENMENKARTSFALVKEGFDNTKPVLVRVHSECITGEALFSKRCDCGWQLKKAMELINREGGVIVYLRQEGRGIGLKNKIFAYELQDKGYDTYEANLKLGFKADERDYEDAVNILKDLGVIDIKLLTNNPEKIKGLENYGIKVSERIDIQDDPHSDNYKYMKTKKDKFNHFLKF